MLFFLLACAEEPPPAQGPECAAYVDCLAAWDEARGITTDVARFSADGDCWGGSEEGARACTEACVNGLAFLVDRVPDLPDACKP